LEKADDAVIDTLLHRCPIVLMSKIESRKLSQLVLGIAGHPLETLVRHQIASVLKIEHCDADRGGLEHGSPTLFARAQRRFRPLAICNMSADASVTDEAPRLVKNRQPRDGDVALGAIGRRPRVLEITER
jgi:hypothetical protein